MSEPNSIPNMEKVITYTPIVHNADTDFSQITNVLLVDSEVQDNQKFVENCNSSTFPITFYQGSKGQDIVDLLAAKLQTITRIAIVANNYLMNSETNSKRLFSYKPYFQSSDLAEGATSYSENVQLLIDLIKTHGVKNIDFLACYSLTYDSWKGYYSVLTKETGVVVGASNDQTGNIKYGGDWTMESTGTDIEAIYFTSGISGYQGTLDTSNITKRGSISYDGTVSKFKFTPSDGSTIEYIAWPCTLSGNITVTIAESLTFTTDQHIFKIENAGDNVTLDGAGHTVTISNVADYPGLVYSRSNNTVVTNIGVIPNSVTTTLVKSGGWIGQGDPINVNSFIGTISNCYSTGDITNCSGGISGDGSGVGGICTISNCYSNGNIINDSSGGIVGWGAGCNVGGKCIITNCYSTGNIISNGGGGIAGGSPGYNFGNCTITNCYSTGSINSSYSGGIAGYDAGSNSGNCTITNCYSTGSIIGDNSGGIVGEIAGNNSGICTITNCYSIGSIGDNSGGITGDSAGANSGNCTITNCYVSGTVSDITRIYFGPNKSTGATDNNCSNSGVGGGWDDDLADSILNYGNGLVNTSGIWKRFVDSNGYLLNIPWKIVTFLTSVDAKILGGTITYSNSLFPINTYAGFTPTFKVTDGPTKVTGTMNPDGKSIDFIWSGSTTNIIQLQVFNGATVEPFAVIDSFILTKISTISSNVIMKRDSIYNYNYTYPLTVTGITTVKIDNNVIVGNLQFIIDNGNTVTIGDISNLRTINVYNVTNYPGLVYSRSNNTNVYGFGLLSSGYTTLAASGGWIGQGDVNNVNSFIGTISNCYSTGDINNSGGGIAGDSAGVGGTCNINNCYSTGSINNNSGGIVGWGAGYGVGGNCNITNCYSSGSISIDSGGIVGSNAGDRGTCTITNCYSNGNINGGSGGIAGAISGTVTISTCIITNCYSTGSISGNYSGGIVGNSTTAGCHIDHCYVTASAISGTNSGAIQPTTGSNAVVTNSGSTSGWVDTSANLYLTGPTTTWKQIALNWAWKLTVFLANVTTNYTSGTLVYTSKFPISAYPNALNVQLYNNGNPYGSTNVTLTQTSVTLTGVSAIANGIPTFLTLSGGSTPDYANVFTIETPPITTLPPTTLAPTTLAPTTLAPTTLAPTTLAPTTLAPTTLAPTTLAPITTTTTTESITTTTTTLPPVTTTTTTAAPITTTTTTLPPVTTTTTTVAPTTLPPTENSIVQFSIDAPFSLLDTEIAMAEYIINLKNQIASYSNAPENTIEVLSVTPGSIVNKVSILITNVPQLQYAIQNNYFEITIDNVTYPAIDNSFIVLDNICFNKGTMILTPSGYRAIETLKSGDLVKTAQGRVTKIVEVTSFIGRADKCSLYVLHKDSLGANKPIMDLYMSEGHAYRNKGNWCHMKCSSTAMKLEEDNIEYHNIVLDNYLEHTLVANGVEVESLFKIPRLKMTWNCGTDNCKSVIKHN